MSFFQETTDMDLGDTPIENIFINDYMPMANGTYVKVYLLGFKYAHDRDMDIELSNETISRNLEIPMEDVLRSWDFWESKGIIKKIYADKNNKMDYRVKFLNLKQLYIRNNIGILREDKEEEEVKVENVERTMKDLIDANRVPEINEMFNNIDYIIRRQTVPAEKKKILSWISDYNMNPDVIEKAFLYSVEVRGKKNLNYIEAIIRNWYDEGLTDIDDVIETFKTNDEKYYNYQKIMKALGLHKRPIKGDEKKTIDRWLEEDEFSMELILEACELDKNTTPSINYVNGILKSWKSKGIEEVDEIEELDKREEKTNKGKSRKASHSVTRFHNFEQRSDKYTADELEDVAKKKREAYIKELKGEV